MLRRCFVIISIIGALFHQAQADVTSFPTPAEIQQSWEQGLKPQTMIFVPPYGIGSAGSPGVDPVVAEIRFNNFFSDSSLAELNFRSAQIWIRVVECHGSVEAATVAFFKNEICPAVKAEVKQLTQNIYQVLSSAPLDAARAFSVKCEGRNCEFLLEEMQIANPTRDLKERTMVAKLQAQISHPLMHPLFTQIVLDQSIAGFPFLTVLKLCDGAFCKSRTYGNLTEPMIYTHLFSFIESNIKEFTGDKSPAALAEVFKRFPRIPYEELQRNWPHYRRTILALQILGLNGLGQSTCQSWGLNYQSNYELIRLMQASQGDYVRQLDPMQRSMAQACGLDPAQKKVSFGYENQRDLEWAFRTAQSLEFRQHYIQKWLQ